VTNVSAKQDAQPVHESIPVAEWIVAAIGGLLVITSFAFLVYRAVIEQERPSFEIEIEAVHSSDHYNSVTVLVRNIGGQPVADLLVRATSDTPESPMATVDYLPAKSSRRVTFVFHKATEISRLSFAVESFTEP